MKAGMLIQVEHWGGIVVLWPATELSMLVETTGAWLAWRGRAFAVVRIACA